MHAQQKSQSNACFQLHMNFCRLYKQKKEKWRHSFKKSNRECKTSPGINYICGICQDLGNYVHLGNWIHQLPPLFAIRYRKYACYVRRDHSLALKCLKMKETSSFCPHVFKCIWYMLYRKENRHDVWTWTWTWVHSPWMRGSQFAVWEIRAVLAVDLRNEEMPSWPIPQTAHAHSGISYRAPLAQGLNVSSCHPNCFLSCWQVLGYCVSNFQVSISDLELSTVKEEKWSFWSCLIMQEMAPSRIFF